MRHQQSCIVVDNSTYLELAVRLAQWFSPVYYYSVWENDYVQVADMAVGCGLEGEGVIRANHPLSMLDTESEPDVWVFPALYHQDLQDHLRDMHKQVFGCGEGDLIERDRAYYYDLLRDGGVPVADSQEIIGVDALREYLQKHDECFIKVSTFRREMDTYHHQDWESSLRWFNGLVARLGPFGQFFRFLVQQPIEDAKEVGGDWLCVDGQLSHFGTFGAESKDDAFLGKVIPTDRFPKGQLASIKPLLPVLKEAHYRNFFSTENRQNKDGAYQTDVTCRAPSPPIECEMENYVNLGMMVQSAAKGEMWPRAMELYEKPWVGEVMIRSKAAEKDPLRVRFPEEIRRWVKMYRFAKISGDYWTIPDITNTPEVGAVCALGDSPEDVIKQIEERVKLVNADDLDYNIDELHHAAKHIEDYEEAYGKV
jgi:hypothetical protein